MAIIDLRKRIFIPTYHVTFSGINPSGIMSTRGFTMESTDRKNARKKFTKERKSNRWSIFYGLKKIKITSIRKCR